MKYGGLKVAWSSKLLDWQLAADHPVNPLRGHVAVEQLKADFSDTQILEDWADAGELERGRWLAAAESIQGERVAELRTAAGPELAEVQLTMFGGTYTLVEELLRDRSFEQLQSVYFAPAGGESTEHHKGVDVFNDIAYSAIRLADAGLRVAVVDLDAHHCSDTEQLLRERVDIHTFSVHEASSATTSYSAPGFTNVGLGAGANDDGLIAAALHVQSQLRELKLDVLIVNAGADGLAADKSSSLSYTVNGLLAATMLISQIASSKDCSVLVTGGGGELPLDETPVVWEHVVGLFMSAIITKDMA